MLSFKLVITFFFTKILTQTLKITRKILEARLLMLMVLIIIILLL